MAMFFHRRSILAVWVFLLFSSLWAEKFNIFCRFQLVDQLGLIYDDFIFPKCLSSTNEKEINKYMDKLALYRRAEYSFFERYVDVHRLCNEVLGPREETLCLEKSQKYVEAVQRSKNLYTQEEDAEIFAAEKKNELRIFNTSNTILIQDFFTSLRPYFGIPSLDSKVYYFERMNKKLFIQHYQLNSSLYFEKARAE